MDLVAQMLMDSQNYILVKNLKETSLGRTDLVMNQSQELFVRRILVSENKAYEKLQNIQGIPKLEFLGFDNGKTYVLEEFLHGTNLSQILKEQGYFAEDEVIKIAFALSEILAKVHNAGIIHRDIKPSNIMQLKDGSYRLIDFGVARVLDSKQEYDTSIQGTRDFAPPEQYGYSQTDFRSDIYSLGKTLRVLLGENYQGALLPILKKCSAYDPEQRFHSASELKEALYPLTAEGKAEAERKLEEEAERKAKEKRKKIFAILATLLICGAGFFFFQKNSAEPEPTEEQKNIAQQTSSETKNKPQVAEQNKKAAEAKPDKNKEAVKKETASTAQAKAENVPIPKAEPQLVPQPQPTPQPQPIPKPSSQQTKVSAQFTTRNWDAFVPAGNSPNAIINERAKSEAAKGYLRVKHLNGQWPKMVVTNKSNVPIVNPRVIINFHNCKVDATNMLVDSWGGRTLHLSANQNLVDGFSDRVTIALNGDIPANDYYEFSLFGNISDYFVYNNSGYVVIQLTADNLDSIFLTQNIIVQ